MYLTIEIVRQSSAVMRGIDFSKTKQVKQKCFL